MSNGLDPERDRQKVCLDMGPTFLQRVLADDKSLSSLHPKSQIRQEKHA